ncbi:MAG TPA: hypothetical protein VI776_10765, partial [Anaerolineales bacterium]|nr:hypothetical protein [Anaerolineales bacterium]
MRPLEPTLSIHFSPSEDGYNVRLAGPQVGEFRGEFAPPYNLATWEAILYALEPGFNLAETENAKQAALRPLGDIGRLHQTVGDALSACLLADKSVRDGLDRSLSLAEGSRLTLPVEFRFAEGCDDLVALPWELLYYKDRFLVADT